jgi:hypothetical protein
MVSVLCATKLKEIITPAPAATNTATRSGGAVMASVLGVAKLKEIITAVTPSGATTRILGILRTGRAAIAVGLVKANAEYSLRKRASSAKKGGRQKNTQPFLASATIRSVERRKVTTMAQITYAWILRKLLQLFGRLKI